MRLNSEAALPFRLTVLLNNVSLSNPYPNGDPFPYTYNPANPVYPSPRRFLPGLELPAGVSSHSGESEHASPIFVEPRHTAADHAELVRLGTYLGTHILHLWNAVELNPAIYVPGIAWRDSTG